MAWRMTTSCIGVGSGAFSPKLAAGVNWGSDFLHERQRFKSSQPHPVIPSERSESRDLHLVVRYYLSAPGADVSPPGESLPPAASPLDEPDTDRAPVKRSPGATQALVAGAALALVTLLAACAQSARTGPSADALRMAGALRRGAGMRRAHDAGAASSLERPSRATRPSSSGSSRSAAASCSTSRTSPSSRSIAHRVRARAPTAPDPFPPRSSSACRRDDTPCSPRASATRRAPTPSWRAPAWPTPSASRSRSTRRRYATRTTVGRTASAIRASALASPIRSPPSSSSTERATSRAIASASVSAFPRRLGGRVPRRRRALCERAANVYGLETGPPRRVVVVEAGNIYVVYDPAEPVVLGDLNQWLILDKRWHVLARMAL